LLNAQHDKRDQSKVSTVTKLNKEAKLSSDTKTPRWHKHALLCGVPI